MAGRTRQRTNRWHWVGAGVAILGLATLSGCRWPGQNEARPTATGVTAPAQTLLDLAYAETSPAQRLDLVLPARTGKAIPLVVLIHGGAFEGGDKNDEPEILQALAAAGYATASVNYRLSPEATFPAGVQDVKAAVRWLRTNAGRWGVDPGLIAAWGTSAGGHLAAMLGTTGSIRSDLDDAELGNPAVSSAVLAVVDWYGPSNFLTMDQQARDPAGCPGKPQRHNPADSPESRWLGAPVPEVPDLARSASPVHYLSPQVRQQIEMASPTPPPFYLVHGMADCLVPYGQSQELARALRNAGGSVTLTLVPDAGHADRSIYTTHLALSIAFLKRVWEEG